MWTVIITILMVITIAICGVDIGVHLMPKYEKPEIEVITRYATTTITEIATTTFYITDDACANELKYCWSVSHNCEDTQPLKDEINSLLISRQEAKNNEQKLLEQLKNCFLQ